MPTRPVTYAEVIQNKSFRILWFNQILVQLAYNSLNFALIIWVFKLVDTNLAVSALMLAIYLPSMVFGVISGVFADLLDKRRIIIAIDLLLAVAFVTLIFVKHSFPLVLINTFIINTLAQFFMPTESSSVPRLVPQKHLFLANSLFSLTLYGALMAGYTLGGPLINNWGFNAICLSGALTLLIAFILAQNLPPILAVEEKIAPVGTLGRKVGWFIDLTIKETRQTFSFIREKLSVSTAMWLLAAVQGVIGILAVVMPSYMERVLRIHAGDVSYIVMLPLGLGMILGAFALGKLYHNRPRRSLVVPAIIGCGLIFLAIALAPYLARVWLNPELPRSIFRLRSFILVPSVSSYFAFLAFLLGLFTVAIIIPCQTVLQENTPSHNRGKIFATLAMIMTAFVVGPIFLAGVLADLFGVTYIFWGLGIVSIIVGIFALRPDLFFKEERLPDKIKEFLGEGHWEGVKN